MFSSIHCGSDCSLRGQRFIACLQGRDGRSFIPPAWRMAGATLWCGEAHPAESNRSILTSGREMGEALPKMSIMGETDEALLSRSIMEELMDARLSWHDCDRF